jgi:hypothetical protein
MKHVADLPVEILVGGSLSGLQCKPTVPYAEEAVRFVAAWSRHLLSHPAIRDYPDVAGFAYWCRPANLARLRRELGEQPRRLGRGLALHIAPANVPVNFAYSFIFGLLAGNANIVRVPERLPAQSGLLCTVAAELLAQPEHARVAAMTRMVRYQRDDTITEALSAMADVRLLWGGDQTIHHLRRMSSSPRCVDIAFADRYSLCLLGAAAINQADAKALDALVGGFYNDVFLLDQNACSSPHLVLWQGSPAEVAAAQDRFWGSVQVLLQTKPRPPGIHAIDKYTHLCRTAIQLEGVRAAPMSNNLVYRMALHEVPADIAEFRGRHGFFYEAIDNDLVQLERIVSERYQTLTYFGLDADHLVDRIIAAGLPGIDRVVPVGKALDIGVIWDGYDLIRSMSRIVATQ